MLCKSVTLETSPKTQHPTSTRSLYWRSRFISMVWGGSHMNFTSKESLKIHEHTGSIWFYMVFCCKFFRHTLTSTTTARKVCHIRRSKMIQPHRTIFLDQTSLDTSSTIVYPLYAIYQPKLPSKYIKQTRYKHP